MRENNEIPRACRAVEQKLGFDWGFHRIASYAARSCRSRHHKHAPETPETFRRPARIFLSND